MRPLNETQDVPLLNQNITYPALPILDCLVFSALKGFELHYFLCHHYLREEVCVVCPKEGHFPNKICTYMHRDIRQQP